MTKIRAVHRFFPVGQGLFSAGSIECWDLSGHEAIKQQYDGSLPAAELTYRWVYDCGSSSGNRLVTNAIADLKRDCEGERIDLLTLSHFHNDHINGVVELLGEIGAQTVMLPWAPLWRRLLIGFNQGMSAADPAMLFYIDPVQYFAQEADGRFEQVLFVMPSDGEGPPFTTDPTAAPDLPRDRDESDKLSGPGKPVSVGDLEGVYGHLDRRVRILRPGETIDIDGVWEFLPYNDPNTEPDDSFGFATKVDSYRGALLNGNEGERQDALDKLRKYYEEIFGYGASMNNVSLILYGGAVGDWTGHSAYDCDCFFHRLIGVCVCGEKNETRGAVLLTGDGNLKNARSWKSLEERLGTSRTRRASVFQVPHHGSKANWHDGLAASAAPKASLFSSDPRHSYGHPHAEVLRDFWPFGAVQVDQQTGFSVRIHLQR